jgi:DNA-binding NarL/FixJ family response regulator
MNIDENNIKIVVADSQYLIVEALHSIISNEPRFSLVKQVSNRYELNKFLSNETADLLITDFSLMDYDGFDEIKLIKQNYPQLAILILTNQLNNNELNEFSKSGIKNILFKTTDRDELFSAIDATIKRRKYYSGEILDMLLELGEKKNSIDEPCQLTSSEIDIVRLIAKGLTTKEIAEHRSISFHTVMTHRKNIFRKLGINNASELLMYAIKAGLIDTIEYHI